MYSLQPTTTTTTYHGLCMSQGYIFMSLIYDKFA